MRHGLYLNGTELEGWVWQDPTTPYPGEVSTAAQSFAGLKTLVNDGALGTGAVSAASSTLRTCAAGYQRSTAQTLTRNAFNVIDFNVSEYDTDSAVTTGATWHFTVPAGKGGLYSVAATVGIIVNSTTFRLIGSVFVNGAEFKRVADDNILFVASATSPCVPGGTICKLAAGDLLDFRIFPGDNTANVTVNSPAVFEVYIVIARIPGS